MQNLLFVVIGAGIGGGLRYYISGLSFRFLPEVFPWGTLVVNVIGSFLLGLIIFIGFEKIASPPHIKNLLTTGFCGGFTTFSTFSFETISLLRSSEYLYAVLNITGNVVLSLLAIIAALYISKITV